MSFFYELISVRFCIFVCLEIVFYTKYLSTSNKL